MLENENNSKEKKKEEVRPAKLYLLICTIAIAVLLTPWFLYLAGIITKTIMAAVVLPSGVLTITIAMAVKKHHCKEKNNSTVY